MLTGPLGSGKTTLLSDYLSFADTSDTGVLVNDAGVVNIDGAVIGADHRNLALATLDGGCVCCSLGNDLQEGIDALLLARAERRLGPPRRIILETSGLAEPARSFARCARSGRSLSMSASSRPSTRRHHLSATASFRTTHRSSRPRRRS